MRTRRRWSEARGWLALVLVVTAVAAPAVALAHIERPTTFPDMAKLDPRVGAVTPDQPDRLRVLPTYLRRVLDLRVDSAHESRVRSSSRGGRNVVHGLDCRAQRVFEPYFGK